jgi:hypothetical protein
MNGHDYTGPGMQASDLEDDGYPDFDSFAPASFNLAATIASLLDKGGPRVSHTGGLTVTRDITSFTVVQDGVELTVAVSPAPPVLRPEYRGRSTPADVPARIVCENTWPSAMADSDLLDTLDGP